ncbi:hypothetical protein F5Y10DRAFT_202175 [Nemania abortiva]|nr:hypothetical protein F5Y10DRAFT_202175 [Nemania abortiva]
MATDSQFMGRQLLRFSATDHLHLRHVTDKDIRFARLIVPVDTLLNNLIPYPTEWAESCWAFQPFLRQWRKRYAVSPRPQDESTFSPPTSVSLPHVSGSLPQTPASLPSSSSITRRQSDHSSASASGTAQVTSLNKKKPGPVPSSNAPTNLKVLTAGLLAGFLIEPRVGPLVFPSRSTLHPQPLDRETPETSALISDFREKLTLTDYTPLDSSSSNTPQPTPLTGSEDTPDPPHPMADSSGAAGSSSAAGTSSGSSSSNGTSSATNITGALSAEQLADIVTRSVAVTMESFCRLNPNLAPAPGNGAANNTPALKPDDIGYFNPGIRDPEGHGIVASGRVTIYTNVHVFTNRLRHLAATRGEQVVREVWGLCLQGTALHWHTVELSDLERAALSKGPIDRLYLPGEQIQKDQV